MSIEQKRRVVKEFTNTLVSVTGVQPELVTIMIDEHELVSLGIAQAGHGKRFGLSRMHEGDGIVCYSPKVTNEGGEPLKSFTALGYILDEEIYQVEESPDFKPFRRRVKYVATRDVETAPLVNDLNFIRRKSYAAGR